MTAADCWFTKPEIEVEYYDGEVETHEHPAEVNWSIVARWRPQPAARHSQPGAEGGEHHCEWRLIAETQDAQYARVTALIEAAKEAGWAMMEVVDGIAWERREQFSNTAARLAKSIEAVEGHSPQQPATSTDEKVGG